MSRHRRFLPEPNTGSLTEAAQSVGVLLINLGTPRAAFKDDVRPYLREFLSDNRVVELPSWLWRPILHGVVLPLRSAKSARKYQQVWLKEGSPLAVHTQALARAVQKACPELSIAYAMTYGEPSVQSVLTQFRQSGIDKIVVAPLFPQYAASSTAAALDQVWRVLMRQRRQMAAHSITGFHDHPGYIEALARHVRRHWSTHGRQPLLMSFHGIPGRNDQAGDPYRLQCEATARHLAKMLNLADEDYRVAFQSRFGKGEWLGPNTHEALKDWARKGVKSVAVICPGFVVDCLETLEEIALQAREDFMEAGGREFHYIPCLNADPEWAAALAQLVRHHAQPWLSGSLKSLG